MVRSVVSIIRTICMSVILLLCAGIISVRVEAADKMLQIDQSLIDKVGNQTQNGSACGCFSMAYCRTILDGRVRYYTEFNNGGTSGYAVWSKANYTERTSTDKQAVFRSIIENIDSGSPVIVYCGYTGRYSSADHYVAIVGYQNVTNINNLSSANFLMYDSGYTYNRTTAILESFNASGMDLGLTDGHYRYFTTTDTQRKPIGIPLDLGNAFDATLTNSSGKSICCRDDGILQMGIYTYAERSKYVWTFEKQSDGSYKITSWSGNSMDCAGAGTTNGTAIQAYTWNGSNAQKYFLYDAGNGKIVLEPACARGSVIDQGGTDWRIHLWEYSTNNNNQMFSLQISAKAKLDSSFNAKIMVYNTDSKKTALYEDSSGDVVHKNWTELNTADKWRYIWHFEKNSDGSYAITNMNDKKGLDCNNWGMSNGTNISTVGYYGSSAQKWNIYDVSGGRYVLEPQCSPGRVADVGGTNGSLHLWQYSNNNANQRFLLVSDEATDLQIEGTDTITVSSPSYSVHLDYTIGGSKEDIVYESLDTNIIKVEDGSDWLTAVSPGTAVLRVKSKSDSKKYKDVTCTVGALELMDYGTLNSNEARILKFDAYTNNAEGDCYLHVKTSVTNDDGQELKIEGDYLADTKGRNWIYCIVDKSDFGNVNGDYTTTAVLYDGNGGVVDECITTYNFSNYKPSYHINVLLDEEFDVYEKADAQSVQSNTRFQYSMNENKNNKNLGEIESISDNTYIGTKVGKLYCSYWNAVTTERLMLIIDIEPEEIIDPVVHEHKYSYRVTKNPTCIEKGIKEYSCSCGDSYTEDIPATGHKLASTVIEPTDEEDGYTLHKCVNEGCDYEYRDNIVLHETSGEEDVHQHSYMETITKAPSCLEAGIKTYTCECGAVYTEGISATGHNYEVQIVDPTPENKGYTLHTCSLCGESYKDNYIEYVGKDDNGDNEKGEESGDTTGDKAGDDKGDKSSGDSGDKTGGDSSGKSGGDSNSDSTTNDKAETTNSSTGEKITLSAMTVTKAKPSTNEILFGWDSDSNSTGYIIEYSVNPDLSGSTSGSWKKNFVGNYRLTKLTENTTYYYRVRSFKGEGETIEYSEWTPIASVSTKKIVVSTENTTNTQTSVTAPKIKLKSVKNNKKKAVTVKWKWNVNADGYQISYAKKKSFSGAKKKNTNAYKESITLKNLSKGKTYYIRVRAYVKDDYGKKVYGKWSSVKKVKIKK